MFIEFKRLWIVLGFSGVVLAVIAAEEMKPPRLVNGQVIEGSVKELTVEGMVIQAPSGEKNYPWKFLSAGTRLRYEKLIPTNAPPAKVKTPAKTAEDKPAAGSSSTNALAAKDAPAKKK